MIRFFSSWARRLSAFGLSALATLLVVGQSAAASLTGEVRDPSGLRIPGVAIALIARDGKVRFTVSDRDGRFLVKDLSPGKYAVWAWSKGFALYENRSFSVGRGRDGWLDISLERGTQQPMIPDAELPRTVHDPAGNLRRTRTHVGAPRGIVATMGFSSDFQLPSGSDSFEGPRCEGVFR